METYIMMYTVFGPHNGCLILSTGLDLSYFARGAQQFWNTVCAYNYFFGSMVLIHNNSTCFVDGWQVFTCFALPGAWLPASRNLGYDYHCHVFWMGRSLCSCWHVFAKTFDQMNLRWKSWRGDHHRYRGGQQTNGTTQIGWELMGNETGWMETDIKTPIVSYGTPSSANI